jgi:hypothetical protein
MEYSTQETKIIYEMKRSIINEFRYLNHKSDIDLPFFIEFDMSIDIESLQHAYKVGMSYAEKKEIKKYDFKDLFDQAICELFNEELIDFKDNKTVIVTELGENMYIFPDRWYA